MTTGLPDVGGAGTAAAVSAVARALYGHDPGPASGVVHVVAVAAPAAPEAPLTVMRIEPGTPKSTLDFFALNFARARAQAIVVTGKILREEPELRYDLQGPGSLPRGLAAWRAAAGLTQPPRLVVLTSGRGLDLRHPALHSWARPLIYTTTEAAAALDGAAVAAVGVPRPSLRSLLAYLASDGVEGVSIEAGPSTARALYEPSLAVDELMLSVFQGPVPPRLIGGELLSPERLDRQLPPRYPASSFQEASGRWTFSLRRPVVSGTWTTAGD